MALVIKTYSQLRFVEDCSQVVNHFVNHHDEVEVIYADNNQGSRL